MGTLLFIVAVVLAPIVLLVWVNRRNPGSFRAKDMSAHDKGGMEEGWAGRVDPDRQHRH